MSRTQDRFYADTPHQGGWFFCSAADLVVVSSTTAPVLVRNAEGDWVLKRTATGAETIFFRTPSNVLRRLLESMNAMEQFGKADGTSGASVGASASPGPLSVAGVPPFTGASQLVPPTAPPSKGIKILDVVSIYRITVADLTSAAILLDKTIFANGVAPSVNSIALTDNSAIVAQANPYAKSSPVTSPVFVTDDLSDVILEQGFVMQNNGVLEMYGLGFHVNFNYD